MGLNSSTAGSWFDEPLKKNSSSHLLLLPEFTPECWDLTFFVSGKSFKIYGRFTRRRHKPLQQLDKEKPEKHLRPHGGKTGHFQTNSPTLF